MKYCIFGSSGSAKEVFFLAKDLGIRIEAFFDLESRENLYDVPVLEERLFDPREYKAIVAVGNPWLRKKIVDKLKEKDSKFYTLIHPSVRRSATVFIGLGSVVSVNSVLTCDISLGGHSQLNSATTIGHECALGDYFTASPGVNIAGNVTTGKCVFFGINSSCIQKVVIADDVFVGAGACVVKDLKKSGMYLGTPARWLPKEFMPETS